MTQPRTFSSEDLTSYLDGEADTNLRRAVDHALADDVALRHRLDHLKLDRVAIAAAFDTLLVTAPPYPSKSGILQLQHRSKRQRWLAIAATALVCFGLGWTASTLITRAKTETWQHYAATYHAMYVTNTLAHVAEDPVAAADDLSRVSSALGLAIVPSALSGADQLEFKRAQVLGFGGRPVVQIAFLAKGGLSKAGAPIALCITRIGVAGSRAIQTDTVLGMAAATWTKDVHEYLLVGGTDASLIATAAAQLAKAL